MERFDAKSEVGRLLRAIYELAGEGVRLDVDVLARLCGWSEDDVRALMALLRRHHLVQAGRVGLTLAGLAIAVGLPEFEADTWSVAQRQCVQAA